MVKGLRRDLSLCTGHGPGLGRDTFLGKEKEKKRKTNKLRNI